MSIQDRKNGHSRSDAAGVQAQATLLLPTTLWEMVDMAERDAELNKAIPGVTVTDDGRAGGVRTLVILSLQCFEDILILGLGQAIAAARKRGENGRDS